MAEIWHDYCPGPLGAKPDMNTSLETTDSLDVFLKLFLDPFYKVFVLRDKYNFYDLNRVENNCKYLADQINAYGYAVSITVKTDWTMADFPILAELDRIRDNVTTLITAFAKMSGSPDMDFTTQFIWDDANDLEQNILNINTLLQRMAAVFLRCGDAHGGDR